MAADRLLETLREMDAKAPAVKFATVRSTLTDEGLDENDIEVRFADGQKYAPITVDADHDSLAFWIVDSFRIRNALPEVIALIEAGDEMRRPDLITVSLREHTARVERAATRWDAARARLAATLGGTDNG